MNRLIDTYIDHQKMAKEAAVCREGLAAVQRALAQVFKKEREREREMD